MNNPPPPEKKTPFRLLTKFEGRQICQPSTLVRPEYQNTVAGKTRAASAIESLRVETRTPRTFPFFVTASIDNKFTPPDAAVLAREQKTLDYFGFTPGHLRRIGGAWLMKDKSYCDPDIDRMREKFQRSAAEFKKEGGKVEDMP